MAAIYGEAYHSDGSKVDKTATISTSWNNKKDWPSQGRYRLEFEENPKKYLRVYVNGSRYTEVYVDGDARLDIYL